MFKWQNKTKAVHPTRLLTFSLILVCNALVQMVFCPPVKADQVKVDQAQPPLRAFSAEYQLKRRGSHLGNGYRQLQISETGIHTLTYGTVASFLFLSDKREEQSRMQLVNDQQDLRPLAYTLKRKGTGKDIHNHVIFEHAQQQVINGRNQQPFAVTYQANLQDQLSYQLQLKLDLILGKNQFAYPVIDRKGRLKPYEFVQLTEETLTLPIGRVKALKFTRDTSSEKRQTYFWLAPDYDYSLVRLQQFEDGQESFDVQLSAFTWQ